MPDQQTEALAIWKELEPKIKALIKSETANCKRSEKVTVVTAPNGSTIGVQRAGDSTTLDIPYVSSLSSVTVGTVLWCEWAYSMSNMIAVSKGDGKI